MTFQNGTYSECILLVNKSMVRKMYLEVCYLKKQKLLETLEQICVDLKGVFSGTQLSCDGSSADFS